MGSKSTSTTKTGNFHDSQNIDNYNNYVEKHTKTYNNYEDHVTNRYGDLTNGNVRNLQGMSNAGNQCFGATCPTLNLMNLANTIGNLHLGTGTHFNVNNVNAAKVGKYQRDNGVDVNIGNAVRNHDG